MPFGGPLHIYIVFEAPSPHQSRCSSILSFGGSSKCAPRKNGDFLVLFCSPKWLNIETWLGLRCMGSRHHLQTDWMDCVYSIYFKHSAAACHLIQSTVLAHCMPVCLRISYMDHLPTRSSAHSVRLVSLLQPNGALTSMPVESSDRAPRHCMTHSICVEHVGTWPRSQGPGFGGRPGCGN